MSISIRNYEWFHFPSIKRFSRSHSQGGISTFSHFLLPFVLIFVYTNICLRMLCMDLEEIHDIPLLLFSKGEKSFKMIFMYFQSFQRGGLLSKMIILLLLLSTYLVWSGGCNDRLYHVWMHCSIFR